MSWIAYTPKAVHWISHAPVCEPKRVRLSMCLQLLIKLQAHAYTNWRHLVAGDESSFCCEYLRDRTWSARDEHTPEVEKGTAASR
jgi:hypothetical protein